MTRNLEDAVLAVLDQAGQALTLSHLTRRLGEQDDRVLTRGVPEVKPVVRALVRQGLVQGGVREMPRQGRDGSTTALVLWRTDQPNKAPSVGDA